MSNALEDLLRQSYARRLSSQQWARFTDQYLLTSETDLTPDLCELLLKQTFSSISSETSLIQKYLQFALLQYNGALDENSSKATTDGSLIPFHIFLGKISKFPRSTVMNQPRQWTTLLNMVNVAVSKTTLSTLIAPAAEDMQTVLVHDILLLLSDIIAHELHQEPAQSDQTDQMLQEENQWQGGINLQREQSTLLVPSMANVNASQMSFDPEATLDMDMLESTQILEDEETKPMSDFNVPEMMGNRKDDDSKPSCCHRNAIIAASIFLSCLADENVLNLLKGEGAQDLKSKLMSTLLLDNPTPSSSTIGNNAKVQQLFVSVKQLTDTLSEKHKIVHMKYHELEDEGTARAMPSAGLMGLMYHLTQIRPSLTDADVVERMIKLQRIKGAFDESFYLELWLAALTGLAEVCSGCNGDQEGEIDSSSIKTKPLHTCTLKSVTSQCLWKNLVLIKLPSLIQQFQQEKTSLTDATDLNSDEIDNEQHNLNGEDKGPKPNALESSLFELRAFSGLLNACSFNSCCFKAFAPASWSESNSSTANADEDDLMLMLNDMSDVDDGLNTPAVIKAVKSESTQDIFKLIVQVCRMNGFVRPEIAKQLQRTVKSLDNQLVLGKSEATDDMSSILDTSMLDFSDGLTADNSIRKDVEPGNEDDYNFITQNIEQRIKTLEENPTTAYTTDLIKIALLSTSHLKTVTDFLLTFIRQKADLLDLRSIAPICEAIPLTPCILDVIFEIYQPTDLLGPLELLCNDWNRSNYSMDMEGSNDFGGQAQDMDDLQSSFEDFGKVWYLVNLTICKFDLSGDLSSVFSNPSGYCYSFFLQYPAVYDSGMADDHIDQFISTWMSALFGNDGISDALLRSSTPQLLIKVAPTLFERSIYAYEAGEMELQNLLGGFAYFKEKFLSYVLVPSAISWLCTEILYNKSVAAITIVRDLFQCEDIPDIFVLLSASQLLSTFAALDIDYVPQEAISGDSDIQNSGKDSLEPQARDIYSRILASCQRQHIGDREVNAATPDNLFSRTRDMLRYIVKSGRSMYMRDVEADTYASAHQQDSLPDISGHYLDMSMFKAALEIGGKRWFLQSIVEEVLQAGQAGGAVRAAELGSCLVATPLSMSANAQSNTLDILRCLLVDIVPSVLASSSPVNHSFFQGQTLGVFISDCMVLTKGFSTNSAATTYAQTVESIIAQFLRQLRAIAKLRLKKRSSENQPKSPNSLGPFASCSDEIIKSPLFRGVIKGLKSNTVLLEKWPNFIVN
ncbi:hypothetical protein INT43_003307 [Umbelopsis isabellina]|uniref:Mediator of RNA polymerase II transcription subunit 5 n=1 Tax=Mortierella isabellina TaxID=91625 RepID=A0A8H7PR98_MORIS|nr:hypothetical protein INT43_003307 [Umbelopsis isabellina]